MKRIIGGWVLAAAGLVTMALGAVGPADTRQGQGDRARALLGGLLAAVCGGLTAAAGHRHAGERDRVLQALSHEPGLSLGRLTELTGLDPELAAYYAGRGPASGSVMADAPWTRAFQGGWAERAREVDRLLGGQAEAVEFVRRKRPLWLKLVLAPVFLIGVVLAFYVVIVLVIPGICLMTWRFASRWDRWRARGTKPPVGAFIFSILFSFAAGVWLCGVLIRHRSTALARKGGRTFLVRYASDPLTQPERPSPGQVREVGLEFDAPAEAYGVRVPDGLAWYQAIRSAGGALEAYQENVRRLMGA